jgi:hypothetical protein
MGSKKNKTNLKNLKSKHKPNNKIIKSHNKSNESNKNNESNESNSPKFQNISGKLKYMFGISPKSIIKLRKLFYNLYSDSDSKNLVTPIKIHQILINFFINEYYPIVSKNIKEDKHTMSIVMGGIAFNMNVPQKMKFLNMPTDDIDLKIYTTEINYMNKPSYKVARVLSVFRYICIIICMFLKQVIPELIEFSKHIFEPEVKKGKTLRKTLTKKKNYNSHSKTHKSSQVYISNKHTKFGVIKSGKIILVIKRNHSMNETFDLMDLSYVETFNLIMKTIDDPDILITNKIKYGIDYQNLKKNSNHNITFSDSKVIYPNIEYPSFYAYYFMNNFKNKNLPTYSLERLIKENILISDIINFKHCDNNCHFISVKTLLLDCSLMLSYAELLNSERVEDIENGRIIVKIGSIFKYYKYIIKFTRLHIIKKYYNKTLKKEFVEEAKKLQLYILQNLKKKTEILPEGHQINILYKNLLNDFHQSFFKTKTLLANFKGLDEIVENYEYNLFYITKSKNLFKDLINQNPDISENSINILSIKSNDEDISSDSSIIHNGNGNGNGNMKGGRKSGSNSKSKLILNNDYEFDDFELDNNLQDISEANKITFKLNNMIRTEIKQLEQISKFLK